MPTAKPRMTFTYLTNTLLKNLEGEGSKGVSVKVPSVSRGTKVCNIIITSPDRAETKSSVRAALSHFYNIKTDPFREVYMPAISSVEVFVVQVELEFDRGTTNIDVRLIFKPTGGDFRGVDYYNDALRARSKTVPRLLKEGRADSRGEAEVLEEVNQAISKEGRGKPVHLRIGQRNYENIIGIVPGRAGQKADLVGVDEEGNHVFFISHKMGSSPNHFQQYSGLSTRSNIHTHDEVVKFKAAIAGMTSADFDKGVMFWRAIKDGKLKQKAVFGSDASSAGVKGSLNAVDFFAQGRPILKTLRPAQSGDELDPSLYAKMSLNFTGQLVHRSNFQSALGNRNNPYEPVLGARKGESYRAFDSETFPRLYGVRGGIWARGYVDERGKSIEIDELEAEPTKKK